MFSGVEIEKNTVVSTWFIVNSNFWVQHDFISSAVKKKASDIPVSSRDVTYQTLPGREEPNYSRTGRVWYVTSRLGTGMSLTFFAVSAVA
jgi:hypothetical protein